MDELVAPMATRENTNGGMPLMPLQNPCKSADSRLSRRLLKARLMSRQLMNRLF